MPIARYARVAIVALIALLSAGPAAARSVDLHPSLCIEGSAEAIAQVARGAYRIAPCRAAPLTGEWTTLHLRHVAALDALAPGWRLVLDENRFTRLVLTATARDGAVQRIALDENMIGSNWAPGNTLSFPIRFAGRDVAALSVAFERLDGSIFVRKVVATDPADEKVRGDHWLLLIGLFVGVVGSALVYNIVIYTGERNAFQRWYIAWAFSVLCYGAWWTGLLGLVSDLLVGPRAVRAECTCLGFVVASGAMFLMNLLEPRMIGRPLRVAGRTIAVASLATAIVASLDWLVPAVPADRWLNGVLMLNTLWVLVTVAAASWRGSRIVRFYLAGWLPVLAIFVLRLGRNVGLMPQSDLVDMATFAAIALESVVLSVTIAHRFGHLRRERDAANREVAMMTIEADTLRRAAETDFLTGLGNRAAFHTALDRLASRTSLFLIDVDHLKEINDSFGHQHGDALLAHVAAQLRVAGAEATMIARIGGDEFAIAVPSDGEAAIADALDTMQGAPWVYGGRSHALSLSIGHANCAAAPIVPATLYQQADFALYRAKRLGRGRRRRYDPDVARLLDIESGLMADAARAIACGEFVLHYQPIVDLDEGRAVGAEALLRWRHPARGLLAPQDFASLLSDDAIGPVIQDQVLTIAIEQMTDLDPRFSYLSVNFTGEQLRGRAAAAHILDRLARAGIPPVRLCVEVTEGVMLDRKGSEVAEALHTLHDAGVRIALDDFGTGYASLIHLQRIPVDIVKIDRSFVAGLDGAEEQADAIVRSILSLAQALGKQVIAEGIETEAQRAALRGLGCRFGQGYLFARPAPFPAFSRPRSQAA